MQIQLDESKLLWSVIGGLLLIVGWFFRKWINVQEDNINNLYEKKQDKSLCNERHNEVNHEQQKNN